jgi:YfiH family protein
MRSDAVGAPERRRHIYDRPWTTTRQVHGARVVVIDSPQGALTLEADAIVTPAANVPIAMLGADCALIAFSSPEGVVAVVHAGWKGLVHGVIEATVAELRVLGATEITAACSPMIHPECYEFSPADLDAVVATLGEGVRGHTSAGRPALDLPAGVTQALHRAGVTQAKSLGGCTACEGDWFSFRARKDQGRHALLCWSDDER